MGRFKKGDEVYIIESMGKKTVCSVVSSSGGFTVVRLPSGGAIRLRDSRIFPVEDEPAAAKEIPMPSLLPTVRDPHEHTDYRSKFGP